MGGLYPDCTVSVQLRSGRSPKLRTIVIISIELKFVIWPTIPAADESRRLFELAREYATREATYQQLWYLHILRRQVGTRIGVVQVNEWFSRLLVLDDESIAIEIDKTAFSTGKPADSSTLPSASPSPALPFSIDEVDRLPIWSRPVNTLISVSSEGERQIDELGWKQFSALMMISLFFAATFEPTIEYDSRSPHSAGHEPNVPPQSIMNHGLAFGSDAIQRGKVSVQCGCAEMGKVHAKRERYRDVKHAVIKSWSNKHDAFRQPDGRKGTAADDEENDGGDQGGDIGDDTGRGGDDVDEGDGTGGRSGQDDDQKVKEGRRGPGGGFHLGLNDGVGVEALQGIGENDTSGIRSMMSSEQRMPSSVTAYRPTSPSLPPLSPQPQPLKADRGEQFSRSQPFLL